MIEYIPIQTGSKGNCVYIGNYDSGILLDCGVSPTKVRKALRKHKVFDKVKMLIVSHSHGDHNKYRNEYINMFNDLVVVDWLSDFSEFEIYGWQFKRYALQHNVENYGYVITDSKTDEKVVWFTDTREFPEIPNVKYTLGLLECNYHTQDFIQAIQDNRSNTSGTREHMGSTKFIDWFTTHKFEHVHICHTTKRQWGLNVFTELSSAFPKQKFTHWESENQLIQCGKLDKLKALLNRVKGD